MKAIYARLGASIVAMAVWSGSVAMAASGPAQGDTSGPAAGKKVKPNTAVMKDEANGGATVGVGAPGVVGKKGAESGHQPASTSGQANAK